MTTETNQEESLTEFSKKMFGPTPTEETPPVEATETADVVEVEEAGEDEEPSIDTSEVNPDEDNSEDEPAEDKPRKRNRFQERIDDLTRARAEADRRADERARENAELSARLKALEESLQPKEKPQAQEGPRPDELNEDGTDKYPLGEYDSQYIRDLTRHALAQERLALREEAEAQARARQIAQEEQAALSAWQEKTKTVEVKYPDFRQKGQDLISSLSDIDAPYGDYLQRTIMSMDHGPEVFYHLASNPAEAREIISSGPLKATIALGKIEARFSGEIQPRRVSNAPTPPARVNRGSAVTHDVLDDNVDLATFAKRMFAKS